MTGTGMIVAPSSEIADHLPQGELRQPPAFRSGRIEDVFEIRRTRASARPAP